LRRINRSRGRGPALLVLLLSLAALGCGRPNARLRRAALDGGAAAFAPPSDLRATLTRPTEIVLAWQHHAREATGYWVEFTTPGADFVKLEVAWPERTTFTHADLAPDTTFIYRVVPFFGRPSAVTIVHGGAAPAGQVALENEGPLEEPGAAPPGVARRSLRTPATIAQAAPADLTATLTGPTTAVLRWSDRANDEDGYLLELARGQGDFQVCALLPADTTSFRKVELPPREVSRFRVRAFFLGSPSAVASASTPHSP
jgi:hypothetical protein